MDSLLSKRVNKLSDKDFIEYFNSVSQELKKGNIKLEINMKQRPSCEICNKNLEEVILQSSTYVKEGLITEEEAKELISDKEKEYNELVKVRDNFILSHVEKREQLEKNVEDLNNEFQELINILEKVEIDPSNISLFYTKMAIKYRQEFYNDLVRRCFTERGYESTYVNCERVKEDISKFQRWFSRVKNENLENAEKEIECLKDEIDKLQEESRSLYLYANFTKDERMIEALKLEKKASELRGIEYDDTKIHEQEELLQNKRKESNEKIKKNRELEYQNSKKIEKLKDKIKEKRKEVTLLKSGYNYQEAEKIIREGFSQLHKRDDNHKTGTLKIRKSDSYSYEGNTKNEIWNIKVKLQKMKNLGEFLYLLTIKEDEVYCNPYEYIATTWRESYDWLGRKSAEFHDYTDTEYP